MESKIESARVSRRVGVILSWRRKLTRRASRRTTVSPFRRRSSSEGRWNWASRCQNFCRLKTRCHRRPVKYLSWRGPLQRRSSTRWLSMLHQNLPDGHGGDLCRHHGYPRSEHWEMPSRQQRYVLVLLLVHGFLVPLQQLLPADLGDRRRRRR